MLSFPPAVRIWLCSAAVDMRRSFDRLAEMVRTHLQDDPLSGHIFVFRNRRSDRVKLLYWDEDGFVILYKRLEEGTFHFPAPAEGQAAVTLRAAGVRPVNGVLDGEEVEVREHGLAPQLALRGGQVVAVHGWRKCGGWDARGRFESFVRFGATSSCPSRFAIEVGTPRKSCVERRLGELRGHRLVKTLQTIAPAIANERWRPIDSCGQSWKR